MRKVPTPGGPQQMPRLIKRRRLGTSLLELMLATSLTAMALVPALRLIKQGLKISGELETRHLTTTYCISKLEEQLCVAAATWSSATLNGNFSADGYSQLRYRVISSDTAPSGGIPDQLMAVSVVVWEDTDSDSNPDSTELQTTMSSKIAKMTTYQDEATP